MLFVDFKDKSMFSEMCLCFKKIYRTIRNLRLQTEKKPTKKQNFQI